jgi:hypothetical protein
MGVIETVKDIGLLVEKLDNIDLVKRIIELQQQVFDVVGENRDLKEQNRVLLEKLTTRASWPVPASWRSCGATASIKARRRAPEWSCRSSARIR